MLTGQHGRALVDLASEGRVQLIVPEIVRDEILRQRREAAEKAWKTADKALAEMHKAGLDVSESKARLKATFGSTANSTGHSPSFSAETASRWNPRPTSTSRSFWNAIWLIDVRGAGKPGMARRHYCGWQLAYVSRHTLCSRTPGICWINASGRICSPWTSSGSGGCTWTSTVAWTLAALSSFYRYAVEEEAAAPGRRPQLDAGPEPVPGHGPVAGGSSGQPSLECADQPAALHRGADQRGPERRDSRSGHDAQHRTLEA